MSESIKIITPTYKRAGDIKAIKCFGESLIIACHESEESEYRKNYPGNDFVIIPEDKKGNMARVRNYIKQNIGCKYFVMVDDDVEYMGYHENEKQYVMKEDRIIEFLENGFEMCEQLGTVLWGVNLQSDPKFYREYSPVGFLTPVLGPFSCHIKSSLDYDERLGLNEDYDYALQVFRKYKKILRFNKYYYKAGHLKQKGGCASYRVMNEEIKQADIMTGKWGGNVVKYDFKKSTNPRLFVPLKGI